VYSTDDLLLWLADNRERLEAPEDLPSAAVEASLIRPDQRDDFAKLVIDLFNAGALNGSVTELDGSWESSLQTAFDLRISPLGEDRVRLIRQSQRPVEPSVTTHFHGNVTAGQIAGRDISNNFSMALERAIELVEADPTLTPEEKAEGVGLLRAMLGRGAGQVIAQGTVVSVVSTAISTALGLG
jgi:hypothetical protein